MASKPKEIDKTPQESLVAEADVIDQDLYIPLSENLIIGFFFDMIHDFPESSVMTGNFRDDVKYMIMMFDSVFGGYWPECLYTLQQIVDYFNHQHLQTTVVKQKQTAGAGETPTEPNAATPTGQRRTSRKPASRKTTAVNQGVPAANPENKQPAKRQPATHRQSWETTDKFISASAFIEKAHRFFYTLVTRQGLNNGVLTFNYVDGVGVPVSSNAKSVITDIDKVAGGGRGLPSNYFFGGFLDHQARIQSTLEATVTMGSAYKDYDDARDGSNIQSFTDAAIKAINLGSPPDYTDSLGAWLETKRPAGVTETKGGGGDAMEILEPSATGVNPVAKPIFVVEDALKSATQLPATFALNNRFVFMAGKDNRFNLVPVKSTAERYDAAAKKLQTPPELYDQGELERNEVLKRISSQQASCYDYFYRRFNLKFGSTISQSPRPAGLINSVVPNPGRDQFPAQWKEFVKLSIGPNKLFFKESARLTLEMAIGSMVLNRMTDDEALSYHDRNGWAQNFVNSILDNTENSILIMPGGKVDDKFAQDATESKSELMSMLERRRAQNIQSVKSGKLSLNYLYNFSFAGNYEKTTKTAFTPLNDDVVFPSYYVPTGVIVSNIRKARQSIAVQMRGVIAKWLAESLEVYGVTQTELMREFQQVLGDKFFVKAPGRTVVDVRKLFHSTGRITEATPQWGPFIAFLAVTQRQSSTPLQIYFQYALHLWKDIDILTNVPGDLKRNQLNTSIKLLLTFVFNLRLVGLCLRRISSRKGSPEVSPSIENTLMSTVWGASLELYLTVIVMSGCSNKSSIEVLPHGSADGTDNVSVPVVGDDEDAVKTGASVASVLHKWRIGIIDSVLGGDAKQLPRAKRARKDEKLAAVADHYDQAGGAGKGSGKDTGKDTGKGKGKDTGKGKGEGKGKDGTEGSTVPKSCLTAHPKDERAKLVCMSEVASRSRTTGIHEQLASWLQQAVSDAYAGYPNTHTTGFTKADLRRQFGQLFQKTAGDFFQVKLSQFLNDTTDCFTCGKAGCGVRSSSVGRYVYRPYTENPVNKEETNAFYDVFKRPAIASAVQLNTFDVMAGLIGLQQSANVLLQTISKTTLSPGTALYGISNLGPQIREYIDNQMATMTGQVATQPVVMLEEEDEVASTKDNTKGAKTTDVGDAKADDDEDTTAKIVSRHSLRKVDLDIDLLSVVRKEPVLMMNNGTNTGSALVEMSNFLMTNDLVASSLTELLNITYSDVVTKFSSDASFKWKAVVRVMFDYMCYYKGIRPEEALARAKLIAFALSNIEATSNDAQELVKGVSASLSDSRSTYAKLGEDTNVVMAPILSKGFFESIQLITKTYPDDQYVSAVFTDINGLLQKASYGAELTDAEEFADSQPPSEFTKAARMWLDLFHTVYLQDNELDAIDALLQLSTRDGSGDGDGSDDGSDDGDDIDYGEDVTGAVGDILGLSATQDLVGLSPMEEDLPGPDSSREIGKKRGRAGGSRKQGSKRMPKHRTIRRTQHPNKTLTEVLRELRLGA